MRDDNWPFYLRISDHAFRRAHQRMPEFINTRSVLDAIMPRVDIEKFKAAELGLSRVTTPKYVFLLSKFSEDAALLVTIIPRKSMTPKSRKHYLDINEIGKDLGRQINEDQASVRPGV